MSARIHLVVPLAGLAILAAAGSAAEGPEAVERLSPRRLAILECPGIMESSGLAPSRRTDGLFWTHNDSGDGPTLFAFDRRGRHLAALGVTDADGRPVRSVDWEDLASFEAGGKAWLLVADIGNNVRRRQVFTLYLVAEPEVGTPGEPATGKVRAAAALRFRYAGGPRNAEGLAVDPAAGAIYLLGKTADGRLFRLPLRMDPTRQVLEAEEVARTGVRTATAMDLASDGRHLAVLSAAGVHEFARADGESWADAIGRGPRRLDLPERRKWEGLCYGRADASLYLTSEYRPTPLFAYPVPGADEADGGDAAKGKGQAGDDGGGEGAGEGEAPEK